MQVRLTELEADYYRAATALDEGEEWLADEQQGLSDATTKLEETEKQLAGACDALQVARARVTELEAAIAVAGSSPKPYEDSRYAQDLALNQITRPD